MPQLGMFQFSAFSGWIFLHQLQLNVVDVMQLLYMYVGMLAINATINSSPLEVVTRIAKVGAVWQVLGQFPLEPRCSSRLPFGSVFSSCMTSSCCVHIQLHAKQFVHL